LSGISANWQEAKHPGERWGGDGHRGGSKGGWLGVPWLHQRISLAPDRAVGIGLLHGGLRRQEGRGRTCRPADRRRRENPAAELIQERRKGKGRGLRFRALGSLFLRKPRAFGVVYFFLTLACWSSYTLHKRIFYRKIETIRRLETMKPGAASFVQESGE